MRTDADLVAGVLAGDREAFAAMYDRYADRLYDFCVSVLRDRHEAEDAVQDTFVLVAGRLAQLNDPDRLRPWLYAVARSVALRKAKARTRVVLDTEVSDMVDPDAGPARAAEQAALRELVWGAAAGLSERDRALLDLHLRQGLDGAELGEAMGVNASHAYVLLTRLRDQVERSMGALLIARLGREDCTDLADLLSGWDGRFSPLMRKRVARHVDNCETCAERRRTMVSPLALLAAVPVLTAPLYLRERVLDEVELVAHRTSTAKRRSDRPTRIPMAAAAAALLLILGLAAVWNRVSTEEGVPLAQDISPTTTESTSAPGTTTTPPATTAPNTTTTPPRTTTTTRRVAPPPAPPPVNPPPAQPPPPPPDTSPPVVTEQPPRQPRINERGCAPDQSLIQAVVTDDRAATSATVAWRSSAGPSGTTTMTQNSGIWSASIGPFDVPPGANTITVTWQVTARDAAGNAGSGKGGTIAVSPCVIG